MSSEAMVMRMKQFDEGHQVESFSRFPAVDFTSLDKGRFPLKIRPLRFVA